jgi:NitT/TauT family transport system ATP-binding protein
MDLMESQSPPALSVDNLSVIYSSAGRKSHTAVDSLALKIEDGEFVSVLGPSGCGKSTLLSVVAGLVAGSRGDVSIFGERVDGPRRDVGVVFQKATLLPWMTVSDNILIPIRAQRKRVAAYRGRVKELLALIGLEEYADAYPEELSGGMQQRVGIARALIHEPKLLLMDEPFAALDAMTRENMSLDLQHLWAETGKSVLFITHSIPEAVFLSDRIMVMSPSPGRIIHEVKVDLPRPRSLETMASKEFTEYCDSIRRLFADFKKKQS